jgi:hypothetical protein
MGMYPTAPYWKAIIVNLNEGWLACSNTANKTATTQKRLTALEDINRRALILFPSVLEDRPKKLVSK